MALASYLVRQNSGIYYFRIVIPQRLREVLGLCEVRRSLGVRDLRQAKTLAMQAALRFNHIFDLADSDSMDADKLRRLTRLGIDPSNRGSYSKLEFESGDLRIKSDPNNPEDGERVERILTSLIESGYFAKPASTPVKVSAESQATGDVPGPNTPKSMAEVVESYLKAHTGKWVHKTAVEYTAIAKRFKDYVGKKPVRTIDSAFLAEYFETQRANGVQLSSLGKHLTVIKGIFERAVTLKAYPSNLQLPTEGQVKLSKGDKARLTMKTGWQPFDLDELKKIFAAKNYATLKSPHEFWLPLLGLFSGCRIEELCQLTIDDVKEVSGHWIFDINMREGNKRLKSSHAVRFVPIHPAIISAGFLDYVRDVEALLGEKKGRVFPYLRDDAVNGLSDVPSEAFKRYRTRIGITHPKKVFHSFRGTANNQLKQVGVGEDVRCELIGHEHASTNTTHYTNPLEVPERARILAENLFFEGLDTSVVRYRPGMFAAYLEREIDRRKRFNNNKSAKQKLELRRQRVTAKSPAT